VAASPVAASPQGVAASMTDGQVLWPAAKKTRGSRKDWGPQHRRDRTSAKRPSWY